MFWTRLTEFLLLGVFSTSPECSVLYPVNGVLFARCLLPTSPELLVFVGVFRCFAPFTRVKLVFVFWTRLNGVFVSGCFFQPHPFTYLFLEPSGDEPRSEITKRVLVTKQGLVGGE